MSCCVFWIAQTPWYTSNTKKRIKSPAGKQDRIASDKLHGSIYEVARYTKIHVRYKFLIAGRLQYLPTPWPWKCLISHLLLKLPIFLKSLLSQSSEWSKKNVLCEKNYCIAQGISGLVQIKSIQLEYRYTIWTISNILSHEETEYWKPHSMGWVHVKNDSTSLALFSLNRKQVKYFSSLLILIMATRVLNAAHCDCRKSSTNCAFPARSSGRVSLR